MISIVRRFWQYQWERFPIPVLLCTTSAVVLSSAGIQQVSIMEKPWSFVAAVLLSLLFLFNMRVLDDKRDFAHDTSFHGDRPIQQGTISLNELSGMNHVGLVVAIILLILLGRTSLIYGLSGLLFSFVAGKDFFVGQTFKKHFLLYNAANFIQMLWVQLLIYVVLDPYFDISHSVLWIHFLFAISNASLIEIVRKIKPPSEESKGKDTYSWHLGFRGALALYLVFFLVTVGLYLGCVWLVRNTFGTYTYLTIGLTAFVALITWFYDSHRTRNGEKVLEGSAIFTYLFLHVSLYLL